MSKKVEAFLVNNYSFFLLGSYFVRLFISEFRPALFYLILNFLLFALYTFRSIGSKIIKVDYLFVFFTLILFSGLLTIISTQSFNTLFYSVFYVLSPMILAFIIQDNIYIEKNKFFCTAQYSLLLMLVFGTIMFYAKPGFYLHYLEVTSLASLDNVTNIAGVGRLCTLVGSIETGQLACFLAIISWYFINQKKRRVVSIIGLLVGITCIILSQQRGPLFALIVIVLASIVFGSKQKIIKMRYVLIGLVGFLLVFLYLSINNPIVYGWMVERISNPSSAITERYGYQWDYISSSFSIFDYIIGNGVGTFEQFAENINHGRILDNMYFNIIGEIGFLGLLLFALIILKACKNSLKNLRCNFACIAIIIAFCFTGLGTTLLYYPMITPFLWFAVGSLFYHNNENNTNERICSANGKQLPSY